MTPEEQSKFDQDLAGFRDTLPLMWWSLYSGLLEQGFNESQAMRLVIAWIRNVKPNDT